MPSMDLPAPWRNWQTRQDLGSGLAEGFRFDPGRGHQEFLSVRNSQRKYPHPENC